MADFDFAPPPFKPDEALQRLKRDWRELGLTEREGRFERRGRAIAQARIDGDALELRMVKKPSRSSADWQPPKRARDAAALRDFTAALKRSLAQWSDDDD